MNMEKALRKATGLTSKKFIKKAIEGGWKNYRTDELDLDGSFIMIGNEWIFKIDTETIYLEPSAWKAVGKVMDWMDSWQEKMHRFIDNLIEQEYE